MTTTGCTCGWDALRSALRAESVAAPAEGPFALTPFALIGDLSDDDVMYDHPIAQSGEPMDPVLFVRFDAIRDRLAARHAPPALDAARLAEVRQYAENNVAVWSDSDDEFSRAVVDIFQKVLNVIDTGDPLPGNPTRAATPASGEPARPQEPEYRPASLTEDEFRNFIRRNPDYQGEPIVERAPPAAGAEPPR